MPVAWLVKSRIPQRLKTLSYLKRQVSGKMSQLSSKRNRKKLSHDIPEYQDFGFGTQQLYSKNPPPKDSIFSEKALILLILEAIRNFRAVFIK